MRHPVQNLCNSRKLGPLGQNRALDHKHWQAQRPRCVQLGARAQAARVLGHHKLRPVLLHQCAVIGFCKRTPGHDNLRQRQRHAVRLVHQTQQVVMLGLGCKVFKMHTPDSQEHTLRITCKRIDGGSDIGHAAPNIAGLRLPRRAGQGSQWNLRCVTRLNRVPAHLRGKWMGRIHDMGDRVFADVVGQTFRAAKPANSHRQRLRTRGFHPSRIRIHSRNPLFRNSFGQSVGLGRAAKNQEVGHV